MATTRDIVKQFFDAMERADLEGALSCCAPDATFTYMPTMVTPNQMPVADALRFLFGTLFAMFEAPGLQLEIRRVIADGAEAAIEYHGHGRTKSGADFASPYAMHFSLVNDRITAIRSYVDTHEVFSKTGRAAPSHR